MFVFRRIVAMLLIAVLASSVMSSPVLRHTHAISDHTQPQREAKPHGHPHAHRHTHSHSHSHGHHNHSEPAYVSHDHGDQTKPKPTLTESAVEHVHLVWLGFEMTLPVSPGDSSDRSDTGDVWVPLLGEMVPIQVEAVANGLNLAGGNVLEMAFAVETPPRVVPPAPPDVSRLCDTARRERSGVLNIQREIRVASVGSLIWPPLYMSVGSKTNRLPMPVDLIPAAIRAECSVRRLRVEDHNSTFGLEKRLVRGAGVYAGVVGVRPDVTALRPPPRGGV